MALVVAAALAQQHDPVFPPPPLPEKASPLRKALLLLRESKTEEARKELEVQRKLRPNDAELLYQIARAHLMDFYRLQDPEKRRISLGLAMETLNTVLKHNADHIPALRAKAVLHARAELLYYDPNLSYTLAARVAKLEPHSNAFLLNLSEWMSGEVRFTQESGHRVPHDPLIGLDRSIELLEQVVDSTLPYSNEETAGLFLMGNTLSRRGNFREAIRYYQQALLRNVTLDQRMASLREMGASYYRMGEFEEAARKFYEAMQWQMNSVDQCLFRVAMDQVKGPPPPLPADYWFPCGRQHSGSGESTGAWIRRDRTIRRHSPAKRQWHLRLGRYRWRRRLRSDRGGQRHILGVYRNQAGRFTDATAEVGLDKVPSGYSLNLVDYDNDGWLDLYISMNGWNGPMADFLFHNERGKFVDVSKTSGADDPGPDSFRCGATWITTAGSIWWSRTAFSKTAACRKSTGIIATAHSRTSPRLPGLDEPPLYGAIGVALGDYDKDGRVDILINGRDTAPNRLYHNDGNWKFTEVARKAGIRTAAAQRLRLFLLGLRQRWLA